ncbi:MAG: riboflavin synthase [Deltaproteobacteria bacterium]|nr:riboflavin synthase [Deltaproteobacteria bacterium]
MFTGLVETTARVASLVRRGPMGVLALRELAIPASELKLGASISVSGVCLTVTRLLEGGFDADVSSETLSVTTLGELSAGSRVNVERSLALGDRLGGHLVLGHVDGVGSVSALDRVGDAWRLVIDAPRELARFFAPKGSVTVDGISLTVNRVDGSRFELMIVPHTLAVTTLGAVAVGARVNLEVDVLARYVARQLDAMAAGLVSGSSETDASLLRALKEAGYTT